MSTTEETKTVVLMSSDKESFTVDYAVASESLVIRHLIEDHVPGDAIPIINVSSKILAKVIEYCKNHVEAHKSDDPADLKNWDAEFMRNMDNDTLFRLIPAADYLCIDGLLDLTFQTVSDMIKHMTPEEIRAMFKIEDDLTEAEKEAVRREHEWAFN